jgi:hypothetical protein
MCYPKQEERMLVVMMHRKLPLFVRTFAFLMLLFTTLWFFSTLTINPWSYQNSSALQLCRSLG